MAKEESNIMKIILQRN